ncbi:unnamed protein product [Strongylus vulgaris]|uniref:Uncharacterized protein n=1 Tax=Strongylus vulgaris TaxID=40348 RepID=A0A3P7LVM7_STRVU|nr:unnamed protein product [Strongylus vulgaris]
MFEAYPVCIVVKFDNETPNYSSSAALGQRPQYDVAVVRAGSGQALRCAIRLDRARFHQPPVWYDIARESTGYLTIRTQAWINPNLIAGAVPHTRILRKIRG